MPNARHSPKLAFRVSETRVVRYSIWDDDKNREYDIARKFARVLTIGAPLLLCFSGTNAYGPVTAVVDVCPCDLTMKPSGENWLSYHGDYSGRRIRVSRKSRRKTREAASAMGVSFAEFKSPGSDSAGGKWLDVCHVGEQYFRARRPDGTKGLGSLCVR